MNTNITDKTVKGFAFKVMLWAIENGVFSKLKNKMELVKSKNSNSIAEYKIAEIGGNPIICVFKEEAEIGDLMSGKVVRYFNHSVNLKDYFKSSEHNFFYISNQWTNSDSSFLSLKSLINLINDIIAPEYKCGFIPKNQEYGSQFVFFVVELKENIVSSENEDACVIDELSAESIEAEYNELLELKIQEDISFSNSELRDNFFFRLLTQNRPKSNTSGLAFYPSLFNKLDSVYFTEWCHKQIDKIEYYTQNGEIINTPQINQFILRDGHVCIIKNGESKEMELLFWHDSTLVSFEGYVKQMKYVSLDHVTSIDKILTSLKDELKALKKVTDLVYNEYGKRQKLLVEEINNINAKLTEADKILLKKELSIIGERIQLQLMPRGLNSAKGNRY